MDGLLSKSAISKSLLTGFPSGKAIKSIQSGEATFSNYTVSVTIDEIEPANAFIYLSGPNMPQHRVYGEITNGTTITINCSNATGGVCWHVVEFEEGIVKSKQTGSRTHDLYEEDVTINAVTPEKCLTIVNTVVKYVNVLGRVTASSNLKLYNTSGQYGITKWQIIEFA